MIQAILTGLGFGLWLSLSIGPVLFTIIKQSLNNGVKGGIAFILGVSASDTSLVVLSNMFTSLFESLKTYKTEVGVAGCIFLVSMGTYLLFFKKAAVNRGAEGVVQFRKRDYAKVFLSGFFMNTLNPSVFIFWITSSAAVMHQSVQERVVIFVTCLVWMLSADFCKVFLAGKIRNRLTPHNIHLINRANGILLIVFGIALIWGLIIYNQRL